MIPLEEMLDEELLEKIDRLFPKRKGNSTYNYTLGKFPNYWQFTLVNDWHKWMGKGLHKDFIGRTLREVCIVFLNYVKDNKIPVKQWAHE